MLVEQQSVQDFALLVQMQAANFRQFHEYTVRLIIIVIRFRASGFGLVAKINIICAKSKQASCAEMVLGAFVFLLV